MSIGALLPLLLVQFMTAMPSSGLGMPARQAMSSRVSCLLLPRISVGRSLSTHIFLLPKQIHFVGCLRFCSMACPRTEVFLALTSCQKACLLDGSCLQVHADQETAFESRISDLAALFAPNADYDAAVFECRVFVGSLPGTLVSSSAADADIILQARSLP